MSEPTQLSDTQLEQEFLQLLRKLTDAQREVIADLVYDIEQGNVNPVNVANRDAVRIALARFEGATCELLDHECATELSRCDFAVALDMTPETPG